MIDFTVDKLPDDALPAIDDLGGDMRMLAELAGVRLALRISELFGGTPLQLYGHRKWIIRYRDAVIRAEYDAGGISAVALARKYGISDRHIWNILGQAPVDDRQLRLF